MNFHFKKIAARAAVLLPLVLSMHAVTASAQVKPKPAPAAVATLDVCHDTVTGNWRYSGMLAISSAAIPEGSVVKIDSWVQNSASPAGYVNALAAPSLTDETALPSTSGSRLARYNTEAAPLLLGTVRNLSRIQVFDPLAPASTPLQLLAFAELGAVVCGCQHPKGCTRTQGYWKSKPGVVWPAPYGRTAMFFSSGISWQQILETPPKGGDAYLILAHQYIAAVLNIAAGASAPASIQTIIASATTFFNSGANLNTCSGSACETQKTWAGILDTYNNGLYPGAPKHCPD